VKCAIALLRRKGNAGLGGFLLGDGEKCTRLAQLIIKRGRDPLS
jgi:hypothetical protein